LKTLCDRQILDGLIARIEEPQRIAKILSHLELAVPEQHQSELPCGKLAGGAAR
jgi:hypothetical protein